MSGVHGAMNGNGENRHLKESDILAPQDVVQARAFGYLFFARLFREPPSKELLKEIAQRRILSNDQPNPPWPDQAKTIAIEFARLFLVPNAAAIHPYESAYCDALTVETPNDCMVGFDKIVGDGFPPTAPLEGLIGGPSMSAVAKIYAEAGFELDPDACELPDHLAIELEFVGRLLERRRLQPARDFFKGHLGRWAFRCLEDIERNAQTDFFRRAAYLLTTFLRCEEEAFTDEQSPYDVSVTVSPSEMVEGG